MKAISLNDKFLRAIFGDGTEDKQALHAQEVEKERARVYTLLTNGVHKGPLKPTRLGELGEPLFWARPDDTYPHNGTYFHEDGSIYNGAYVDPTTSEEVVPLIFGGVSYPICEWGAPATSWRDPFYEVLGSTSCASDEAWSALWDEMEQSIESARADQVIASARAEKSARKQAKSAPVAEVPASPFAALAALKGKL
jgi:hypothetical protein